jgi:hypothetical protein
MASRTDLTTRERDPLLLHHEFNTLSLTDLLEARQKNHVELMRKKNVVGTAVGLYLIRRSDPWPPKKTPARKSKRTMANSEVRPYSWPSILVFVRNWENESDLDWEERVPRALYLDDNRKVPVCVVEAPPIQTAEPIVRNVVFPSSRIGGGFPVIASVQGKEHLASIGCLLTDGHTTYALTNRHVTGEPGEIVYGRFGGRQVRIGVSSAKHLTRKRFTDVYPGWPGKNVYLHMDIGLIRIDDATRWTAQVYGIGTMGEIADLGIDNITLRLIDSPVQAYGCASGKVHGAIKALFYRYRAMGGFDFVADFLIGARNEKQPFITHHGDSGTVWMLETSDAGLQPIAVQWGGELFSDESGRPQLSCALATGLSNVCNLLDVDVIRDWNIGGPDYWGETGHYTIGALACTVNFTGAPRLQKLMSNNLDRVGFNQADLKRNEKVLRNQAHYQFVPLADVADEIWRTSRPSDSNNHFADMDQTAPSGPFKGKTLLDLCKDPKNIDPQVWSDFYAAVPGTNPGSLPFRVWQIYEAMVGYAAKSDALHFLAAAGCLAHYVGDACQPLHISRLHHGNPPLKKGSVAYGVHTVYETMMLNDKAPEVVDGVAALCKNKPVTSTFSSGSGAAKRVIDLMRSTVTTLPPVDIVDSYNKATSPAARIDRLWQDFGQKTIQVMAAGAICLADIWVSAWTEGSGEQIPQADLGPGDIATLESYYNDAAFLPSIGLAQLAQTLLAPAPPPAVIKKKPSKKANTKKTSKKKAPKKKA